MWASFGLVSAILFGLGAIIGSFLNVVIYRTVTEESWVTGRSRCDHCHKKIVWYDNIPLLSFLWLKGKCRWCHQPISLTHPVVEFLTGSLFVWWYIAGFFFFTLTQRPLHTLQPLFWLLVGVLLLIIFFADLLYMIIPDAVVIVLSVLTLLYRVVLIGFGVMQLSDFNWALIGMALSVGLFAGLWLVTKGRGMGFGDVKLAAPLALLLGWPNALLGVFLSFMLGAVVGLGLLGTKQKKIGQVIPFGPFMVVATFISLVWGDYLINWYWGFL